MPNIKKIKLGETSYDIKDARTVDTVNGYSFEDVNKQTVTFANEPITNEIIDSLLAAASK